MKRTGIRFLILGLILLAFGFSAALAEPPKALVDDCNALTKGSHRLTGSPELKAAADHVEAELKKMGLQVVSQEFNTAGLNKKRCELIKKDGAKLSLEPMRPNGITPPVTPKVGITGQLVDVGSGTVAEYPKKMPAQAIAVIDYNCRQRWLDAFRLGAKAVIFVRRSDLSSSHFHYSNAQANVPRFYYAGEPGDLPIGEEVTIHGEEVWNKARGRNVFGFLTGTEPTFDSAKGEEVLIIAANLDSFGEVPHLNQGARTAANCAGLLQIARQMKANPPKRHVLFAFFDAQSYGHLGSCAFYGVIDPKRGAVIETSASSIAAERDFLTGTLALLEQESPLASREAENLDILEDRLRKKGENEVFELNSRLIIWRVLRNHLLKEQEPNYKLIKYRFRALGETEWAKNVETMTAEQIETIITDLSNGKKAWNDMRRSITKQEFSGGKMVYWTGKEFNVWASVLGFLAILGLLTAFFGRDGKRLGFSALGICGVGAVIIIVLSVMTARGSKIPKNRTSSGPGEQGLFFKIIGRKRERAPQEDIEKALAKAIVMVKADVEARLAELKENEDVLTAEKELFLLLGSRWISLHISLGVGDTTPRWGVIIGGQSGMRSFNDNPGVYTQIQNLFLKASKKLVEDKQPLSKFETKSADLTLSPPDALWANRSLVHSGEIAGRLGIYNLVLGTAQERLPREATPDDTLDRLDLARMADQFEEIGRTCKFVADDDSLSRSRSITVDAKYVTAEFVQGRLKGSFVMAAQGSAVPNKPTPNAVIHLRYQAPLRQFAFSEEKLIGFNNFQVLMSDQNGTYTYGPGPSRDGRVRGFAAVFDDRGEVIMASTGESLTQVKSRLNIFRCQPGSLVLPSQPEPVETKVLDGMTNGALQAAKSYAGTEDGFTFWFCEETIKSIKLFSTDAAVLLNNGPQYLDENAGGTELQKEEEINGTGLNLYDWQPPAVSRRAAVDLWRLNNHRLNILRSKGIKDSSMAAIHGQAEDLLAESAQSEIPEQAEAQAESAFLMQKKIYSEIRTMLDDLVIAVLILLGLSVPFAFALERLLIGSSTIYKQLGWFVTFFIITFFLLYLTHPAFAISKTPPVIFLGFAIVVLSGMVIIIIMQKFEVELKILQGLESTVHAADISRVSTVMAAMSMGISSMRRRPLRTALSAVTIVLLTFTILCFASFGSQIGIVSLFSQPSPDYHGAYVHRYDWKALSPDIAKLLNGRWGAEAEICPRYWLSPLPRSKNSVLLSRADGSSPLVLKGVVGISPKELEYRLDLAKVIKTSGADIEDMVFVSNVVAADLKLEVGDKVLLQGHELTLGPLLDPVRVSVLRDMDDSSCLPVDFEEQSSMSQNNQSDTSPEAMAASDSQSWQTVSADECVFVGMNRAREMGARLHAICVYTNDPAKAKEISQGIAHILPLPIAGTLSDGVYKQVLGAKLSASGIKDLLFPILLGGLVIFGTMLGSVADREKEIYTFSALGLAPTHVAGLFFAEAMVYSVIGGLGGYLLAQASMKVLTFMATYGLVRVPEMNYSSTNAIVTILLVMGTVLISALYPAYKASKSANPGVMRSWKVPQPDGDVLSLVFPFTVSDYDITGVVSFLKEHFETHSDTGLGCFMSQDTKLVTKGDHVGLKSHLALAPFDLGVTQGFQLKSSPSEIEGIDEVAIRLERKSGQPKDWYRLNKVLLDDLRRQFLIWRSLPPETMEVYRERTLTEMGKAPPKPPEAGTEPSEGTDA